MRTKTQLSSGIVMALIFHVANVSAQQTIEFLPETFPGSGGLSESRGSSELPPAYPQWPERPVRREMIPPPPGGPYMSSALSDVDAFPADTGGLRDEFGQPTMDPPFFEVDMPWPETPDRGAPEAWIPEGGEYHFVPEEIVRQLESSSQGRWPPPPMRPPYPGYRPAPPMPQPGYGYR